MVVGSHGDTHWRREAGERDDARSRVQQQSRQGKMTRAALGARAVVRVAAATEAGRGVLGTAGQRNGRLATVGATRQAPRVVRARAEDPKKDVGGAEADEFLGGAVGKFISGLTEFAANSPINQGKM